MFWCASKEENKRICKKITHTHTYPKMLCWILFPLTFNHIPSHEQIDMYARLWYNEERLRKRRTWCKKKETRRKIVTFIASSKTNIPQKFIDIRNIAHSTFSLLKITAFFMVKIYRHVKSVSCGCFRKQLYFCLFCLWLILFEICCYGRFICFIFNFFEWKDELDEELFRFFARYAVEFDDNDNDNDNDIGIVYLFLTSKGSSVNTLGFKHSFVYSWLFFKLNFFVGTLFVKSNMGQLEFGVMLVCSLKELVRSMFVCSKLNEHERFINTIRSHTIRSLNDLFLESLGRINVCKLKYCLIIRWGHQCHTRILNIPAGMNRRDQNMKMEKIYFLKYYYLIPFIDLIRYF